MTSISNLKIGKKLALASLASLLQLACLAGLSLWALNDLNSAAAKAEHYALKMNVAQKIVDRQSEIALRIGNLPATRQLSRDVEEIMTLSKEYSEGFDFLRKEATTDEDRGKLLTIEQLAAPDRDYNHRIVQALQAGKRMDAAGVRAEALFRFEALKPPLVAYLQYRQKRLDTFQQEQKATGVPRVRLWLIGFALFSVVTTLLLNTLTARSITTPLTAVVTGLSHLAQGDLSKDAPVELQKRKDELGTLARTMQTMTVALRKMIQEIAGEIQVLSSSSNELMASSSGMTSGSRNASDKAHSVSAAAEEMSSNITSVAAGMEQTTTNLAHVASATEQMTSTIGEIAQNSEKARRITDEATRQTVRITEQINQLGAAAREIGKVTETITEISSQTNLLALNATIEAARAGSAGKGFAVVATEIKALAQQTAAATEDIKARIGGVQAATSGGITEIGKVSQIIAEVSAIVASIAAAIEEQATATKDIATNIAQASVGVTDSNERVSETSQVSREIAKDIVIVDRAAEEMATGSDRVRSSAGELSAVAEALRVTVGRFHA
jgi:methyl-accepting chemotaxis protein